MGQIIGLRHVLQAAGGKMMNGFVRVLALLPGLILTVDLLNRAGADWFGAYIATILTVCLSVLLSERFIMAPEYALTGELVFSSVYIMGLGHGAARIILLLGALLALPVGKLLAGCTERFRRVTASTAGLGLSLLLLSDGLANGGIILPAVMTHSQLGNLLAPAVLVTVLTLLVMGILRIGKSTKGYTLAGGLLFSFLLAAGEGFIDFDRGIFALPSPADLGKVWFAFDFPGAWEIFMAAPGEIFLPAVTIGITMGTMTAAVFQTAEATAEKGADFDQPAGLNGKASFLGVVSACLGSGPVTVSPLTLLEWGEGSRQSGNDRYGMGLGAVLLLFSAPLARSVAECPGVVAPLYIWLGGFLAARVLGALTVSVSGDGPAAESGLVAAASMLAALSHNLTAGIGTALAGQLLLQLISGRGREVSRAEWLIAGCYLIYFTAYCF